MSSYEWLPLFEYSSKYKVSVSTLRRRIKGEDIQYKLDGGRYFIIDSPPDKTATPTPRPKEISRPVQSTQQKAEADEPVFTTASRLLDELKKAYTLILQEKDEQIRLLREEISDLKTLVRVLEADRES